MRFLLLLALSALLLGSCIENEFKDDQLGENPYGNPYASKEAVTFNGFNQQGIGQSCNLVLSFSIDTSDFGVHPDNVEGVLLYQNNELVRNIEPNRSTTVLQRSCSKPKQFKFQYTDKEGYPIGEPTIVLWN